MSFLNRLLGRNPAGSTPAAVEQAAQGMSLPPQLPTLRQVCQAAEARQSESAVHERQPEVVGAGK